MRDMPLQSSQALLGPQERKINPLGRPNKRFLGRTINTALRHNKRETDRTHASCQQKLQELDERHDRRQRNEFYTSREDTRHSRSRKKSSKRRSHSYSRRSSSSSDSSERRSRRRKQKKRTKKHKKEKRKKRHRSTSSSSNSSSVKEQPKPDERSEYFMPANNLALAVAMAYSQVLSAQQMPAKVEEEALPAPASPLSDIIKELMSDEDVEVERKTLSVESSSDEVQEVLTINLSSQEEHSSDSDTDSTSESGDGGASCIALEDSAADEEEEPHSGSDIEIIEVASKQAKSMPAASSTTVDLTED
ncbi:hypothetical protein KR044_006578 [Drosophila immigrans]|nr:hypothetical protein KR044_006578 [Drosophila immigrans]